MDKRRVIRNIRSNQVVDGSPKLPTAEQILHGEIAINFAKEHETLSLKNDNDEIVAFELRSVSNLDEKLNEEIERVQTAEQANATAITAEEARARAAEVKNASDINAEITRATEKEADLLEKIGNNTEKINENKSAIATETTRATTAEGELKADIEKNKTDIANAKAVADKAASDLVKEIERATAAEQANAMAITAEETRASQKEKEISDLLGTKTDTKDEDTAFGRIAKEINDRTNAINSLDATVGATSVESGKHVAVQVVETDGKLTALTVTENDIASAAALAQEIEDRQTAIAQEVTNRNTAIDSAIDALDKSETTASAENAHVTVKYSETNGIVSMNVTESDIASAQGLADEITRATNSENTIKETYLKNINVNGIDGEFSDNVASLTVKGKDIDVADDYTAVEYPKEFEDKAKSYHIAKTDKIDSAFNKVENTFKVLSEEVINNELTNSNAINNLAYATGVIANDDSISYVNYQKGHYIQDALTVHHATMLLDDALADVSNSIKDLGNVDDVKVNGKSVVSSNKVANIIMNATRIPLTDSQGETSTIFSELTSIKKSVSDGENSLETKINALKTNLDGNVNDLTNKIIEDELVTANSISALADSAGLITIGNEIKYVKKAKPYYIAEAETLADAINLLDDRIKLIEGLIDTKIKKAIYDLIKANPTLVNPYDSNTSNA